MNNFDYKKYLVENKLTSNSKMLNEYVEMDLNDLGPEFEKTIKEIFGETVKVVDIKATYRPSTDTGAKPMLYISITIPQTKESTKALLLSIVFEKDGQGYISYNNYSKDKEDTKEEFNNKLVPAFKKAAVLTLGKLIKNPNQLTSATMGGGYKYEEKDQADLDKYVSEIPNLPIKNK